ncbi:MAG: transposase [Novosphingobium sp.]
MLPIDAGNRGRGHRPEQNRSVINGILWRLRCGAPWRDVPPKYGNWNRIYRRFRRWSEVGVWEAADCKAYDALIVLPEQAPQALLADKGYDADRSCEPWHTSRHSRPVNRRVRIEHDLALYKQRNRIERMFGQLKINRAIATRYDQLAASFMSMVPIAGARYWRKFVHAAWQKRGLQDARARIRALLQISCQ